MSVLLGKGDGTFQTAVEHSAGQNPSAVVVGDFNRDGKLDVVVTDQGSNKISVLLGNGAGSFQSVVTYAVGQNPVSVAVGDFNCDGRLDLPVAKQTVGYTVPTNALSVALGDFNSDGQLDMAVPDGASAVSILLQTHPLSGPNATLSTTSMLFQCRNVINVGCQCSTKGTLTLGNYGNQTLNITGITITGPFSEGNNCGTSLKAGRFCSISVTWQRVSGSGTLSIANDSSGSPQVVSLFGQKFCTPLAMINTAGHIACAMNSSR